MDWYKIENKKDGTPPTIMLFGPIGGGYYEDGSSAIGFIKELKALGKQEEIVVHINSPGGSVFQGNSIYNALVAHPAKITVKIDLAASIASVIAMAGDERSIPRNGMMMIHLPKAGVSGTAPDLRKMADMLDKITENIIDTYKSRTNLSLERLREMVDDETWITAKEAVEFGFATQMTDAIPITNLLPGFSPTNSIEDDMPTVAHESPPTPQPPTAVIDRAFLNMHHPEIVAAIMAEGATAERGRIQAIHAAIVPGSESTIVPLMFDGSKNEVDALRAVNAHMRSIKEIALADFRADAPAPVPGAADEDATDPAAFMVEVNQLKGAGMSTASAMSEVMISNPLAYSAYMSVNQKVRK